MAPAISAAIESPERAALAHQASEQGRRRPARTVLAMECLNPLVDQAESGTIGEEHRSAPPRREAIPGDVDRVDVRGPNHQAVFDHARSFVDEGVNRALDNLVVRE